MELLDWMFPHIKIFDPYYPAAIRQAFTSLYSHLQYLHAFPPIPVSKAALKKKKSKWCIYLMLKVKWHKAFRGAKLRTAFPHPNAHFPETTILQP